MVSKILTVRNTIQDVLGIRVSLEDANEIIERLEAWQAEQAAEQSFAPDEACASCKSTYFVKRNDGVEICDSCSTPRPIKTGDYDLQKEIK